MNHGNKNTRFKCRLNCLVGSNYMKIVVYVLCIPIKVAATLICIPLMAFAIALSFSICGDNDVNVAKSVIKDIWI